MNSYKIRVIPEKAQKAKESYERSKNFYNQVGFPSLPFIDELTSKLFEAINNVDTDPNEGWILIEPGSADDKAYSFFTSNWIEAQNLSDAEVAEFISKKNSHEKSAQPL